MTVHVVLKKDFYGYNITQPEIYIELLRHFTIKVRFTVVVYSPLIYRTESRLIRLEKSTVNEHY
jgi:hypothetical protein